MKRIVLTGGGTAGHVTPNIALIEKLRKEGYDIHYIGGNSIEKQLIEAEKIPFYVISNGKLRRYLDMKNVTDIFKVIKGVNDARKVLAKLKPNLIFSKGGFVAVPVVLAAKLCGIPIIIHESDITPGLANKIALPFATKICVTFAETLNYVDKQKGVLTGSPIRQKLFEGDRRLGLKYLGFGGNKPVLLVMGGSQGSVKINSVLRECLPKITAEFDVIHLCGKGNLSARESKGYAQFEYVNEEMSNLLAASDIVISRAGANSICELLALKKPNLLIPLSLKASRGDQILNAKSFESEGFSIVLQEEDLSESSLIKNINSLYKNKDTYIQSMARSASSQGAANVMEQIRAVLKGM